MVVYKRCVNYLPVTSNIVVENVAPVAIDACKNLKHFEAITTIAKVGLITGNDFTERILFMETDVC